MDVRDIKSLYRSELDAEFKKMGEKGFRSGQVFDWIHNKKKTSFDEMTNLSKGLRDKLKDNYDICSMTCADVLVSKIDGTKKFLLAMKDGNVIETVLMQYDYGTSLCISSQVGCRMGCKFCASTLNGLVRNLTASEMLEEVYCIQRHHNERIDHIVIMGCGEPMDNYDNVVRFIRLISDEKGHNLSQRHVTVSSCGVVPGIRALADEGLAVTLALSLHAPDDESRRKIMPVANKYTLKETLLACDYYFEKTGRRVSYEYCLIDEINDTDAHVAALSKLLAGKNCHVNLIPMNPVKERDNLKESRSGAVLFKNKLEKQGINATIRKKMGRDIAGACGQLRNSFIEQSDGADAL